MDNDCFNGAGIPLHQPMEFQAAAAAAMAVQWNGQNCPSEMGFLNPNLDHFSHMESSLSSFVSSSSSPVAAANEAFLLRELIGKFGGPGTPAGHCVDEVNLRSGLNSAKVQFPIVDQINPNLGNSVTLPPPPPPLQSIAADPGFIERAAKFSCFGSRSFNGRSSPIGNGSTTPPLTVESKLHRVASSPALKPNGSPLQNRNISPNSTQILTEIKPAIIPIAPPSDKKVGKTAGSGSGANSNEESSVSNGETLSKNETSSSRKRKGASRVKSKEEGSSFPVNKGDDDGNAKRPKATTPESSKNETLGKTCSNNDEKAADKKPPEPPKDYIHVRARRGQATDSHSLAERVRREKISERMKLLQDLVPGCNKVTGKALMLDEIINYVQSLQRQVEFLSMKLASVNPGLDFNTENLLSKDTVYHHNTSLPPPQQMYSTPEVPLYQHNVQQQLHQETSSIPRGPLSHSPVDHPLHFSPVVDGFTETFPQFPGFSEDDLHSIVQMGFLQNPTNFPAVPNMKIER